MRFFVFFTKKTPIFEISGTIITDFFAKQKGKGGK